MAQITKHDNDSKTWEFEPTPSISTDITALVAGPYFECVTNTQVHLARIHLAFTAWGFISDIMYIIGFNGMRWR